MSRVEVADLVAERGFTQDGKWRAEMRALGFMPCFDLAYLAHPERFVRRPPRPLALLAAAWINQPQEDPISTAI